MRLADGDDFVSVVEGAAGEGASYVACCAEYLSCIRIVSPWLAICLEGMEV